MSNLQFLTTFKGISDLTTHTTSIPSPGPNQVLVKIHAVSLNYRDIEVIQGQYGHHKSLGDQNSGEVEGLVPCSDMSGEIIKVGDGVREWKAGDQVLSTFIQGHVAGEIKEEDMSTGLGLPLTGVLQQYRLFPAHALVRKPAYLTHIEGCTLPIAAVTAWNAFHGLQPLKSGDWVLLQGTGGVSIAAAQIAKASGARVILVSGSPKKIERAVQDIGIDISINYKETPNWDEKVLEITGGRGVDHILEVTGQSTLERSFSCIRFGGQISCIGYVSGKGPTDGQYNLNVVALRRGVTVKGILVGGRDMFEDMLRAYEANKIKPIVDRVVGFDKEEVTGAFEYVKQGGHYGKVVIKVA
ncbi:hypothetical protein HDU85_004935 [Gaertneriomyces sp. JEL0708]|nr:hypothetical protein HDU85_004935 [Gaertneriomyces sp. JEL0708]